jgi:hypothetical protein
MFTRRSPRGRRLSIDCNAKLGVSSTLRIRVRSPSAGTALETSRGMTIKITPNDKGNPPGKLADAELHFSDGPLEGLKLIGFSVWERRGGGGGRNVTFPARSYVVNGDRRSFALLRPIVDSTAQGKLRDLILEAFQEYEERAAIAS